MSAIISPPTRTNSPPVAVAPQEPEMRETTGLVDAVVCLGDAQRFLDFLGHLERASHRQILDKLDAVYDPSPERMEMRRRIMDTITWFRKEVESWVQSSSPEQSEISVKDQPPSGSNSKTRRPAS